MINRPPEVVPLAVDLDVGLVRMGGSVALGYNVEDRKLIVNAAEVETVRTIFTLHARSSSTAEVIRELDAREIRTKTGRPHDKIRNRPTGDASGPLRLPAGIVEDAVVGEIRRMIRAPEIAARTIKLLPDERPRVDEKAVVKALGEFDQLWPALYPTEQTRIVNLLSERVTIGEDGIAVDLRHEGLGSALREMIAPRQTET